MTATLTEPPIAEADVEPVPTYRYGEHKWMVLVVLVTALIGIFWSFRHVYVLTGVLRGDITGRPSDFAVVWAVAFVLFAQQMGLAWAERRHTTTDRQAAALRQLTITLNVPLYNEEPALVLRSVRSLFEQSWPPNRIEVVDDGSDIDYTEVRAQCDAIAAQHPDVRWSWVRTENGGKRAAQCVTFAEDDADIYITVDSDTLLEYRAIEEGMKPFADPRVQSVAGMYLGLNATENWVTRIAELICVTWQLVGRSATSTMGAVIVNSGAFALYRGAVLRDNVDVYLHETFFGRHVPFSDDAHLAMLASLRGRTVQQPTAASFTLYPTSFRVYCKQYTRWMRGAFIRAWWRLRYLPLKNYAFWNEVQSWVQFIVATVVFVALYAVWPAVDHRFYAWSLVIPLLLGYVICSRYLMVQRSDMSQRQIFGMVALAPVMVLWSWLVCRPIRFYAIATFNRRTWGTRVASGG